MLQLKYCYGRKISLNKHVCHAICPPYTALAPVPCTYNTNTKKRRHHHHHKHQGLEPLIRSVSRVTTALANVSSVFQLFSFLVVCSNMISKGFGLVAFFASVKASSVCIHLSCLVRILSVDFVIHIAGSQSFGSRGCNSKYCNIVRRDTLFGNSVRAVFPYHVILIF